MRKRKRELTALYEEECSASATQEEPDDQLRKEETDNQPRKEEPDDQPRKEEPDDQPRKEETDGEPEKKREKTDDNRRETTDGAILQPEERTAFYRLLDEDYIQLFLARDSCYKIADKYLLAMVFMYFRRANLRPEEYNPYFFPALFLANQFEEDEMFRREIYPWALGPMWTTMKTWMLHLRNQLLLRMGFDALVTRDACDRIMAQDPEYWAWKRERKEHHGWAIRWYRRDPGDDIPRGPWWIPPACSLCSVHLQPRTEGETINRRRTKKEEQNG